MGLNSLIRNFTIRIRMWSAIGGVLAALLVLGSLGIVALSKARSVTESFLSHEFAATPQQNAALVSEEAAEARSLKEQAQKLVELVDTFKLDAFVGHQSHLLGAPTTRAASAKAPMRQSTPRLKRPHIIEPDPKQRPTVSQAKTARAEAIAGDGDWQSL